MTQLSSQKSRMSLFVFIAALIAILMRHIDFFMYPRFWAEEGTEYFLDAYNNGLSALFHVHQGYFSLIPNLATYIATMLPLEDAPVATTFFALIVHIIPFYLIYISRSEFLATPMKKALASLSVLLVSHTAEIWLNTITSQFHFIIIVFIILLEHIDKLSMSKRYGFYLLILIAGLSGVPANILAPLFLYKYFVSKNKVNLHFLMILTFTTITQLIFIMTAEGTGLERMGHVGFEALGNIFVSLFQHPVFYSLKVGYRTLLILPLVYIIIKYLSQKNYFILFFGSSFLLTCIMVITSLEMYGGARYLYAPNVIFILGLLTGIFDLSLPRAIRRILGVYVAIAFFTGIQHFPVKGAIDSKAWVKWKDQVRLYQDHSIDVIVISPQGKASWTMTLPRK